MKPSIYNNFCNVNFFISPTVCDIKYNILIVVYKQFKIFKMYDILSSLRLKNRNLYM